MCVVDVEDMVKHPTEVDMDLMEIQHSSLLEIYGPDSAASLMLPTTRIRAVAAAAASVEPQPICDQRFHSSLRSQTDLATLEALVQALRALAVSHRMEMYYLGRIETSTVREVTRRLHDRAVAPVAEREAAPSGQLAFGLEHISSAHEEGLMVAARKTRSMRIWHDADTADWDGFDTLGLIWNGGNEMEM